MLLVIFIKSHSIKRFFKKSELTVYIRYYKQFSKNAHLKTNFLNTTLKLLTYCVYMRHLLPLPCPLMNAIEEEKIILAI